MKKLIIACAAVLVLGLGLTTVGHVLGGQFYSVYYKVRCIRSAMPHKIFPINL